MTRQTARPLPDPTPTSQPFWNGARDGKFMLQYDPASRGYQFWPRDCSVLSGKRNLRWKETSGHGAIYAVTETHVAAAGFEGQQPYLVGLIDLDEGVRIIGNLVNFKAADAVIGARVRVVWEKISDEITYFAFEPE